MTEELIENLKANSGTVSNIQLLDTTIAIQLTKIEKRLKLKPITSKDTELAMSNLVELLKIRDGYSNL